MSDFTTPKDLTHDEKKAAEAAFRGLPPDARWSGPARAVYDGVALAMQSRGGSITPSIEPPASDQPAQGAAATPTEAPVAAADAPAAAQSGLPVLLRSRQEAIDLGFLIDVTPEASRIGLPIQVGLTKPLWDIAVTASEEISEAEEQDFRLRDILMALRLRLATSKPGSPLFEFPVLLTFPPEPVPKLCSMLALLHEDASAQAVTLVLREEVSTIIAPPGN